MNPEEKEQHHLLKQSENDDPEDLPLPYPLINKSPSSSKMINFFKSFRKGDLILRQEIYGYLLFKQRIDPIYYAVRFFILIIVVAITIVLLVKEENLTRTGLVLGIIQTIVSIITAFMMGCMWYLVKNLTNESLNQISDENPICCCYGSKGEAYWYSGIHILNVLISLALLLDYFETLGYEGKGSIIIWIYTIIIVLMVFSEVSGIMILLGLYLAVFYLIFMICLLLALPFMCIFGLGCRSAIKSIFSEKVRDPLVSMSLYIKLIHSNPQCSFAPEIRAIPKSQICFICKKKIKANQLAVTSKAHYQVFHHDCLDDWIINQKNCPICQQEQVTQQH